MHSFTYNNNSSSNSNRYNASSGVSTSNASSMNNSGLHEAGQQQSQMQSALRKTNFGVNLELKKHMLLNSHIKPTAAASKLSLHSASTTHTSASNNNNNNNIHSSNFNGTIGHGNGFTLKQQQPYSMQQQGNSQSPLKLPEILPLNSSNSSFHGQNIIGVSSVATGFLNTSGAAAAPNATATTFSPMKHQNIGMAILMNGSTYSSNSPSLLSLNNSAKRTQVKTPVRHPLAVLEKRSASTGQLLTSNDDSPQQKLGLRSSNPGAVAQQSQISLSPVKRGYKVASQFSTGGIGILSSSSSTNNININNNNSIGNGNSMNNLMSSASSRLLINSKSSKRGSMSFHQINNISSTSKTLGSSNQVSMPTATTNSQQQTGLGQQQASVLLTGSSAAVATNGTAAVATGVDSAPEEQKKVLSLSISNSLLPQSFATSLRRMQTQSSVLIFDSQPQLPEESSQSNQIQMNATGFKGRVDKRASTIFVNRPQAIMAAGMASLAEVPDDDGQFNGAMKDKESLQISSQNIGIGEGGGSSGVAAFQQTEEQKRFGDEMLAKIRRKQNARSKSQLVFGSSAGDDGESYSNGGNAKNGNHPDDSSSLSGGGGGASAAESLDKIAANKQEYIEAFRKALKADVAKEGSLIRHHLNFLLPSVEVNLFVNVASGLISQALTIASNAAGAAAAAADVAATTKGVGALSSPKGNSETINNSNNNNNLNTLKKKINWKMPQKLLSSILEQFRVISHLRSSDSVRFEYYVINAENELGLAPSNLLEELGGAERCRVLVSDFYKRICAKWANASAAMGGLLQEKQVIEVGMAVLTNNSAVVESFIEQTKSLLRANAKDLAGFKVFLMKFLFEEYSEYFDDETKIRFVSRFESIRYRHFLGFESSAEDLALDLFRIMSTRKPIQEYFDVKRRDEKLQSFALAIIDSIVYEKRPSDVAGWLRQYAVKKPIDENFFFLLNPIIVEALKRAKMAPLFFVNARMKLYWIRVALNCAGALDARNLAQKMPQLIMNLDNWIGNMVSMKQVSALDQQSVRSTKFIQRFMLNVFTEDLFNAADVRYLLEDFAITQDAVLIQLKGIKRVLLLMRYNTNDAYAVTEFLTNVFNESISTMEH